MNIIDFLLNKTAGDKEKEEQQTVSAPAFSITKVLSTVALIVAPLVTIITDVESKKVQITSWQYVALALGLLGFLAVVSSADVWARAYATAHKAEQMNAAHLLRFAEPLTGHLKDKASKPVHVLAAAEGDEPYFLVVPKENGSRPEWKPVANVELK